MNARAMSVAAREFELWAKVDCIETNAISAVLAQHGLMELSAEHARHLLFATCIQRSWCCVMMTGKCKRKRRRCYLVRHGCVDYFGEQGSPLNPLLGKLVWSIT